VAVIGVVGENASGLAMAASAQLAQDRRGRVRGVRARSERALVRAAQRGSTEAFDELFRRHWPAAHRAAYLVVHDAAAAEDIAQEAFLAALRSLDRFDWRRPLAPWLHRIVVNRAIDWSRARRLRAEVDAERGSLAQRDHVCADPAVASAAGNERIVAALRELGPEQRAVVVLRYLLEYTPGEIAKLLELPRGTVNSRLRRALDALGEDFGEGAT
jgi:RNA polymerase sigma-70 factor, ECF subfamily